MIKKVVTHSIAFVLGIIVCTVVGVYAASTLSSSSVYYDNSTSGGTSTNVAGALDELYSKSKLKNRSNIVEAYTYNQTSGTSNYCVTGDEETCVETKCYESTTAGSCPAGTIIIYKVNENEIVRFHVMYDNGATLTMQSQRNTIYNTQWIDKADYAIENTDGTSCSYTACNDEGPITILEALESATAGWSNVKPQTYTMGTTIFKTNAYTGCYPADTCDKNIYTLPQRTAKARMITVQEALNLGCAENNKNCPIWMYNYLTNSKSNGGTIDDSNNGPNGTGNTGYWMLNGYTSYAYFAWYVYYDSYVHYYYLDHNAFGARAVVEINK